MKVFALIVLLVACTAATPVTTPPPMPGGSALSVGGPVNAFKLRSVTIHYALRPHNAFFAVADTLVADFTAPASNGGSAITGFTIRTYKSVGATDSTVVQTSTLGPTIRQDKWLITGIAPSQVVSLWACGEARNLAGAGDTGCAAHKSYTGPDVVPGVITITVTKKP